MTERYWQTGAGMRRTKKQMRPRDPKDFYPTPLALCTSALALLDDIPPRPMILDPGCGTGVWGQAARELWLDAWITGVDVDAQRLEVCRDTGAYNLLHRRSYTDLALTGHRDLVVGNPPYSSAEAFICKSLDLLRPGGQLVFLLRLAFLESQRRYKKFYSNGLRPSKVAILVERPSFTGNGKTDATAYAIFVWRKGGAPVTALEWLSWRQR